MSNKRDRSSPKARNSKGSILLISYFFPPTAGGGVFRPLAMVKYLSGFGWDITVLTATTPKHYPIDEDLKRQVPADVKIVRMPVVWEGSWFRRLLGKINLDWIPKVLLTPDERIFWAEKACSHARKLYQEEKFDIIYSTGPPYSVLVAGLWLGRMKDIKSKWVAEFRDPWTISPYVRTRNPHQKRFADDTESDLMEVADSVIMVTPGFVKKMQEKYPEHASKIACVQNGFDEDDFANLPMVSGSSDEKCTIVASGTVTGPNNMNDFLDALEKIRMSDSVTWQKISVMFQGLPDAALNRRLLESGLNERCKSKGFVKHSENITDLVTADLLILPVPKAPNSNGHIPSRTYEYLASGTNILAICDEGDLSELVKNFPQVEICGTGNIDEIAEKIKDAVGRWEMSTDRFDPDPNELRNLTRKARAKELEILFDGLMEKQGNNS